MSDALSISLSALGANSAKVDAAAKNIAESPTGGTIIEDIIDIKVAESAYKANVSVIKTVQDMNDELLKIFDETV